MRLTLWGNQAAAHFALQELTIIRTKTPNKKLSFTKTVGDDVETNIVTVMEFINSDFMFSVSRKEFPRVEALLETRTKSWSISLVADNVYFRFLTNENTYYEEMEGAPPLLRTFLGFRFKKVTMSMINDFLVELDPTAVVDMKGWRSVEVESHTIDFLTSLVNATPAGSWAEDDDVAEDTSTDLFSVGAVPNFPKAFMDLIQADDNFYIEEVEVRDKVDFGDQLIEYIRVAAAEELVLGTSEIPAEVIREVDQGKALGYVASSIAQVLGWDQTSKLLVVNAANFLLKQTRANNSVKKILLNPNNKFVCVSKEDEATSRVRSLVDMMNADEDVSEGAMSAAAEVL
jgi:hypothetical protein